MYNLNLSSEADKCNHLYWIVEEIKAKMMSYLTLIL